MPNFALGSASDFSHWTQKLDENVMPDIKISAVEMRNEADPKLSQRSLFLLHCAGAPLLGLANLPLILYEHLRTAETMFSKTLTRNGNLQAELHNS